MTELFLIAALAISPLSGCRTTSHRNWIKELPDASDCWSFSLEKRNWNDGCHLNKFEEMNLAPQPLGATGYQIEPRMLSMTIEEEENMMRWFIWKRAPGADVIFVDDGQEPQGLGWEKLPFRFRGKQVWIKRKPISIHMEAILQSA